jgi:hypothetical protein
MSPCDFSLERLSRDEFRSQTLGEPGIVRVGVCPHPTGFVLLLRGRRRAAVGGKVPRSRPHVRSGCLWRRKLCYIGASRILPLRWTDRDQLLTALPL